MNFLRKTLTFSGLLLSEVSYFFNPRKPFSWLVNEWSLMVGQSETGGVLDSDQRVVLTPWIAYFYYATLTVYQLTLYILYPQTTHFRQVVSFDITGFLQLPQPTHLGACSAAVTSGCFYYCFYCMMHGNRAVASITSLMLEHHTTILFGDHWAEERVRRRVRNMFRLLCWIGVGGCDLIIPSYYPLFLLTLLRLTQENGVSGLLLAFQIVFQLACYSLWVFGLFMIVHFGLLAMPMAQCFSLIVAERAAYCQRHLSTRAYPVLAMLLVRTANTRSLLFVLEFNKIFSYILLLFLVGEVPLSGTLLVAGLTKSYALPLQAATLMLCSGQLFIIIVMHFFAARISTLLHKPYKRMVSLNVRVKRLPARVRFQLDSHVQAFTEKKHHYGITYACFGLVSYATLVKFFLIYGEVLMYNFSSLLYDKHLI